MPASPGGNAFGEQLRRARESRGVTVDAIADATRISRRHLEALERSDLDALPGGPFAKGFIEAYAKVLGIDPRPILETYRARLKQQGLGTAEGERRMLDEMSQLLERRGEGRKKPAALRVRPGHLALAVVVLGVLGALGWALCRGRGPRPSVPSSNDASPAARASATPAPTPAGPRSGTPPPRSTPGTTTRPSVVVPPTEALEVREHGVGTGVADHRLVGRSDRFAEGTTVVFWTSVVGGQAGQVLRHVWFHEGGAVMRAALPIGGFNWRTNSHLALPRGSAGRWTVEARASDGRLLARDEFVCVSGGEP